MAYGTDAAVQNLVHGTTNSDWDAATTAARNLSTQIINSELDILTDISSPSDKVTQCANLLAAGIFTSEPGKLEENAYYKMGMKMLEKLKGDNTGDSPWHTSIVVEGFGRHENISHDPTIPY